MSLIMELKYLLLQVLPSPTMMAQGRSLCIQNHLAMICDSLWAINSMIVIPEMLVLCKNHLKFETSDDSVLLDGVARSNLGLHPMDVAAITDIPVEIADWETDVAAAVTDVGGLLDRILDWEASLHRSIVGNTQQEHFRHVILVELKETLCNLNSLVFRGSAMGLRRDPMESMNPLQEDYSIVLQNEVLGREKDLEKLIAIIQQQQLVSSNNNGDDSDPFVIVIYGELGVGKATLARMIYHHTWVRQQFHHRIWVDLHADSPFKMINIIGKEFARSINNEEYCDQKLQLEQPPQAMWEYINEQLDGSRYLLVLHFEAWIFFSKQSWDELKNILLRVGGPGSAVLIIHQSSTNVMSFINEVKNITTYCLNPLLEDEWVELFKRHAATTIPPWKHNKSENDKLIPFVKQNFQNFIDRPFFAKIVGWSGYDIQATLLDSSTDFLEDIYRLKDFPLFLVRFQEYCHLFDRDTLLTGDDNYNVIVHMLTAECLIRAEDFEPADWSERNLSEFMFPRMVYLHMKVSEDSTTIPRSCRYLSLKINPRQIPFRLSAIPVEVSDKLITFILQEIENEETTLEVYEKTHTKAATTILEFLSKMSVRLVHLRILVVESSMIQRLPSEVSKLVNLRYLHLSKIKMELLPKSLFELPNLRILSLLRCQKLQKISEGIRKLKKLQILKVAYCTKLQRLPKSITTLKNLEVLNVECCCWLSELPEDLVRFKSLRILNVVGCASLSHMPRGIEQLIDLRKLLGIFLSVDGGFGLAKLQALTNLQEIRLRNLEEGKETQTEVLMGQQSLRELSLHWGGEEASSESATPLQVLEALRPNVHLRKLEIISYKGVEFPTWMSKQQLARFVSLVEVRLVNLRSCATLPSLGQLPFLEKLEISGMNLIKQIDDTFYGDGDVFPKLKALTFSEMLALEKWYMPERIFPFLQLTLIQCPKLKEIDSEFDFHYWKMRVWLNNETMWSAEFYSWNNLRNITEIEIVGCQELKCLPHAMQNLNNLSSMTIKSCNNLTTLVALDLLERLYLCACPVIEFNLEVFTGLSYLRIRDCPKIQIYSDDAWLKKIKELRKKKMEKLRRKKIGELEELWRKKREKLRRKIKELEESRMKMIEELEGKKTEELEELLRKKIEELWREEEVEEELWRKKIEELEKKESEELWEEERFQLRWGRSEESDNDNTSSSLSQT